MRVGSHCSVLNAHPNWQKGSSTSWSLKQLTISTSRDLIYISKVLYLDNFLMICIRKSFGSAKLRCLPLFLLLCWYHSLSLSIYKSLLHTGVLPTWLETAALQHAWFWFQDCRMLENLNLQSHSYWAANNLGNECWNWYFAWLNFGICNRPEKKLISYSFFYDFWEGKTFTLFTTRWSGGRVQLWVQV